VLHLAAAKSGDFYAQYASTVVATENLLWAMTEAHVCHIVAVSSFSVYDYLRPRSFTLLTEESPLEANAYERDAYAQTKLAQERLVREHAVTHSWRWTILRPGVIFGKKNLWTARLGAEAGRWWIRIGGWAQLPLTYVENCAEAIIKAAEERSANGATLNVVDDDLPNQRAYAAFLREHTFPRPHILPVPWSLARVAAFSACLVNRLVLNGSAKVPGILVPARLHARMKPLRFSNQRVKTVLGWKPRFGWREGVLRSLSRESGIESQSVGTHTFEDVTFQPS
jgi:nucleoside-diphosphate-sugar epimerase